MKGKQPEKKKGLTPVILVDESEELTNTVIISKMINQKQNASVKQSSNVFSGGFKYRPEEGITKNIQQNISKGSPSKLDKLTVYDEFGIINDSIGKKKYRQNPKETPNMFMDVNPARLISESNPWRKQVPIVHNNFMDPGYYEMSKLKERQQTAVHVKSSLQVINLDNIQAKLQAHRQQMKPIQEQYNLSKGKSSLQSDSKSRDKLRFNIDADKQFKELQPSRVYQLIKQKQGNMERPNEELMLQQLWQQRKKKDPKLAEYDFKYQQFLVEKEAKKMIGEVVKTNLFTWDKYAMQNELQKRKIAKKHKSKEKCYGEQVESKVLEKVYGQSSLSPAKGPEEVVAASEGDIRQKIASKDDKFIGKFVMAEIDVDKRGTVSKDQLVQYLNSKEHLIKGYHIDLKWLHTDLDNFQTKRKGMLNQQEIIQFLATLDSLHHPALALKDVHPQKTNGSLFPSEQKTQKTQQKLITSYFKEHLPRFQKIFNLIDVNDDRLIKREEYLQSIYLDSDCTNILDKTVLKFNIIDKAITFRQILGVILDDYRKQKNDKLKKSKQYISFQRFKEYFQLPEYLDLKTLDNSQTSKLKKQKTSTEIEMFDIEQEYLFILKDIFDTIPRVYQEYIISNDFTAIALKDPQVLAIADEMCRIQSYQTNLPVQTIRSTLLRMNKECDQYATWEILKVYFSRRGRPLDWDFELIQKKKEVRQNKLKAGKDMAQSKLQANPNNEDEFDRKQQMTETIKSRNVRNSSVQKYTVPQPFKITDEQRKSVAKSKELSSEQKQIEEMKKKFKAKPVNKDILQPNPDLIQGKLPQTSQKSPYNYENYQNDRIERVLKRAQEDFEQRQTIKQIKRMAEVKANNINVDLKKKLETVMEEKKKNIGKSKPKPTKPEVGANLYPDPKEVEAKKLDRYKKQLQKQNQAAKMREDLKKQTKDRAKQKNEQVKKAAEQQKKKEQQQKRQRQKLQQDSFKPSINKRDLSEGEKEAIRKFQEEKQLKKKEDIKTKMQIADNQKLKRLNYVKKETKLELAGLEDEQILNRFEEVDFEDLLLDEGDKAAFRKEYNFKQKTRKEVKQRYRGLAGRERAAMQAEEKRLAEEKRKTKQQKQEKAVQQKIDAARQKKNNITSTLNMQTDFHRSKALRRYRAIIEGKPPLSQFDSYSIAGGSNFDAKSRMPQDVQQVAQFDEEQG